MFKKTFIGISEKQFLDIKSGKTGYKIISVNYIDKNWFSITSPDYPTYTNILAQITPNDKIEEFQTDLICDKDTKVCICNESASKFREIFSSNGYGRYMLTVRTQE